MATWQYPVVDSCANAMVAFMTSGGGTAIIKWLNSSGSEVGTSNMSASPFAAAVSGVISANTIAAATATGSHTLGTALVFNRAGTTFGSFVCTTAAGIDFVFGGLVVASADTINVNSWTVTVSAS